MISVQIFLTLLGVCFWLGETCIMPEVAPPNFRISQEMWNVFRHKQRLQFRAHIRCPSISRGYCDVRIKESKRLRGSCILLDVPTCVHTSVKRFSVSRVYSKRKHPECQRHFGNSIRPPTPPPMSEDDVEDQIIRHKYGFSSSPAQEVIPCYFNVTVPRYLTGRCTITKASPGRRGKYGCQAFESPFTLDLFSPDCRYLERRY